MEAVRQLITDVEPSAPARTAYVIRLIVPGIYVAKAPQCAASPIDQWADRDHAIRFDTMTRAIMAAIEIFELSPEAFTVEAV
jgi:hypothetical protein